MNNRLITKLIITPLIGAASAWWNRSKVKLPMKARTSANTTIV